MRVRNGKLQFNPFLPGKWKSFSFTIGFRGATLKINITENGISIKNNTAVRLEIGIRNQVYKLDGNAEIEVNNADLV
ncbi:hypothetical protein D3C85_1462160 [compost metagenome]